MAKTATKKTAEAGVPAAQAEGEGATHVTVDVSDEWPGTAPFTVPLSRSDWPASVYLALEANQDMHALRGLMGPVAFAQFMAHDPTRSDALGVLNRIGETLGVPDAGESDGSSGS